MTKIIIHPEWSKQLNVEGLAVFIAQDDLKKRLGFLSQEEQKLIVEEAKNEKFIGKKGQVMVFPLWTAPYARRVMMIGIGQMKSLTDEELRKASACMIKTAIKYSLKTIAIESAVYLPKDEKAKDIIPDLVEGMLLAQYTFKKYKSSKKEDDSDDVDEALVEKVVFSHLIKREIPALEALVEMGESYAQATILARDLVNEPSSHTTPTTLVHMAQGLAESSKSIQCKVFGRKELEEKKFGCILGVAQGSQEEPYLIHLIYKPRNKETKKLYLVGKGITFDSGGISIKPSEGMETMKMDMAGAASVLAVFQQIANLEPKLEVHGIIATCENMPSGSAIKPGDVITAYNGKTIEVLNTDAEGRLVLADALAYAVEQGASYIVDIATLTGACIVALGNDIAGMFGNNDALLNKVMESAIDAGEKLWELPLEESYEEYMKGDIADLRNISSKKGAGAITGALFLKPFVGNTPWVHLDIAGPAWNEGNGVAYMQKGATGFGVRTLLRLLSRLS